MGIWGSCWLAGLAGTPAGGRPTAGRRQARYRLGALLVEAGARRQKKTSKNPSRASIVYGKLPSQHLLATEATSNAV